MADPAQQLLVVDLADGRCPVHMLVASRRGDLQAVVGQHGADRLDTPTQATGFTVAGVVVDEVHDQREGRSRSAMLLCQGGGLMPRWASAGVRVWPAGRLVRR